MAKPVFLIGPRASGKTTVGKELARKLGWGFVDTDSYLAETTGESVQEVVEKYGWEAFREREHNTLLAVAAPDAVVATGGGIVEREENRRFLHTFGICFYLHAPVAVLISRLAEGIDANRPSLTGKPIAKEMQEIIEKRAVMYEKTSHYTIDATLCVLEIVDKIVKRLAEES